MFLYEESGSICQQIVASCCVVYIASVQALNDKLAWKSEVFADLEGLFVYVFAREVFCDAAVISVAQLSLIVLMVKQIVNVHVIHVALNILEVDVISLAIGFILFIAYIPIFGLLGFFFRAAVPVVCFFEPWVS